MLRRGGAARLVNVTSGLGSVAIPYLGAYSAAQFAKEGVSDALRRELAPMGIQVSVVSPGAIWTPIWGKIASEGERALADAPDAVADLYRDTYLRFLQANEDGARNSATKPADVAAAVHAALTAAKPRTRYRVGADVRRGTLLARLLPDSVIDGMFRPDRHRRPGGEGGATCLIATETGRGTDLATARALRRPAGGRRAASRASRRRASGVGGDALPRRAQGPQPSGRPPRRPAGRRTLREAYRQPARGDR